MSKETVGLWDWFSSRGCDWDFREQNSRGGEDFSEKGREDFSKWRVDDIFLKVEKWGEGLGLGRGDCWTEGRGGE